MAMLITMKSDTTTLLKIISYCCLLVIIILPCMRLKIYFNDRKELLKSSVVSMESYDIKQEQSPAKVEPIYALV